MPNIPTFDAGDLALHPSETGVESVAAAARRGGAFFNAAGEAMNAVGASEQETGRALGSALASIGQNADAIQKFEAHQEISHGLATVAAARDNLTKQWNDTVSNPNTDPNDTSVAGKFRENVFEPWAEKFVGAFTTNEGQDWAEQHVAALREHFYQKTAADMSTAAGKAVRQNVDDYLTHSTNTAYNDPTTVPALLKTLKKDIDALVGTSGNLSGVDAIKVKSDIMAEATQRFVQAGAMGAIRKGADPEKAAADWSQKYPDQISGEDQAKLEGNAKAQVRARQADQDAAQRRADKAAKDASEAATSNYYTAIKSSDPRLVGDPMATKILNDPTVLPKDKANLIKEIERQKKPETDERTSAMTSVQLIRELRAPNANLDEVMQHAWDARQKDPGTPGSLTQKDLTSIRNEIIDRKTPEGAELARTRDQFFKNYSYAIAPDSFQPGNADPALYAAEQDAKKQEQRMRAQGKDPSVIYDPTSPDFFGKPENIVRFNPSMQQNLRDRLNAATSAIQGRNPSGQGEQVLSVQVTNIPDGMSPAEAMKWVKEQKLAPGTPIRLPNGQMGKVPGG